MPFDNPTTIQNSKVTFAVNPKHKLTIASRISSPVNYNRPHYRCTSTNALRCRQYSFLARYDSAALCREANTIYTRYTTETQLEIFASGHRLLIPPIEASSATVSTTI